MRIARLDLLRYGRFSDRSLRFERRDIDLHFICGANEAGKSTAKSAIEDLLFGFGRTSSYAFLHEQTALRVGAIVEDETSALEFRRRKGNKDTLLGPDDKPLAGDPLRAFLGGADRDFFARMWSLDHVRLREGGRQILDAKDDVGRMLFEAGAGLAGLREHLARLDEEADAIYAPRAASHRSFYAAQGRLKSADDLLRETTITARDWRHARDAYDALVAKLLELDKSLLEKKARRGRLERIRRVLPVLAELHRNEAAVRILGDPMILPADAASVLQAAERDLLAADALLRQLDTLDQETARALSLLSVDEALLGREREIDALHAQQGAAAKARSDGTRRAAELSEKEKQLANLLAEIERPTGTLAEIEGLLPSRPDVQKIRALLETRSGLDAALIAATEEKSSSEDDLAALQSLMRDQPATVDFAPLAGAAHAARNRAELAPELRRATLDVEKLDRQIAAETTALVPFRGDAESLRALPVPAEAYVEETRVRLLEFAQRLREIDLESEKIDRDRTEAIRAKQHLLLRGAAVALEDVASAREARDRMWTLLRRRHVEGLPIEDAEVYAVAGPSDLSSAFEATIRRADEVSDRRFLGAQDSARLVELEFRISEREVRRAELATERRTLEETKERAWQAWIAAWSACGFLPDTPEAMAEWVKKRAGVLSLLEARSERALQRASLGEEEQALRGQLLAALTAAGSDVARPGSAPLGALLAEADERLKTLAAEASEQKALSAQIQKATTRRAAAQRRYDIAASAIADWERAWRDAVEKAGRDPREPRETTRAALLVYDEIRGAAEQARDLTERIRKIADDTAAFDEAARRLSTLLDTRDEALSSDAAATALADALKTHRERKTRRDTLSSQRTQRAEERAKAEEQRVHADHQIRQLLRAAGCDSVDALRRAIENARVQKDHRDRIEQALRHLAEAGNGADRETLERECAGIDRDRMPAELEQLEIEIESESERRRAADLEVAEAKRRLDQIAGDDTASAAAADRQLALSEMQDEAQRYAKLRAASALLRWAIDRHRQTKQGPLLARAATLFRGLTGGAFVSLCVDLDDQDRPILLAVRSDARQVPVSGMSDGTVDQLYLSLRLAAIDEHLATAPPLPLIADDLFIHFDDTRSAAGIQALADLARRSQVLFFTHHAHLVDVAADAIGRENFSVHRL